MPNTEVTQSIIDSGFKIVDIKDGVGTFKKIIDNSTYYLAKHSDGNIIIMNHKSDILFRGYPMSEQDIKCLITILRI